MTEFLLALKDDLTDRRLLPLVGIVCALLVGALAYALLGGGSSAAPGTPAAPLPSAPLAGAPISQAQTAVTGAIAETANGAAVQRSGAARDPFRALPGAVAVKASTPAPPSSGSGAGSSKSSSGGSEGGGAQPKSTETKSSGSGAGSGSGSSGGGKPAPAKPKKLYDVAVEFGPLPEGAPPNTPLQAYAGLSKATALPSAAQKLVEFVGVTVNGSSRSATFELIGEAILHGEAACHPSATQCRLITLKEGHKEQMEFLTGSGQVAVYELRVVSIASANASSAAVAKAARAQAQLAGAGELSGLLGAAGMHFAAQPGVIVFAARIASAARAHGARRHSR